MFALMSTRQNARFALLTLVALSPFLMACAVAQERTSELNSQAPAGGSPDSPGPTDAADDQWHMRFLPYLWFPGMHGTTGVRGFNTSVRASAGDLLSHFDIGLMATVEARKSRMVLPVDLMWVRLSDEKALPENEIGVDSIGASVGQFILTPKGGYQIIDTPRFKVEALVGMRYWHLGEKLKFNPTIYNGVSTSENWVDGVAGGRIQMVLSPKASIVIAGDAGGGGANPDYQVGGVLGFKVKKNVVLQAGWRYLDVHYRNNSNAFLYDIAESGAVLGATFYLK
jgi:hypothetical protein